MVFIPGPPYYSCDPALCEPPDGAYSFIEWEDLRPNQRLGMALQRAGVPHHGLTNETLALLREMAASTDEVALVADVRMERNRAVRFAEQQEEANAKAREEAAKRKWLMADPREIAVAIHYKDQGLQPYLAKTEYALPEHALVERSGHMVTPAIPGVIIHGQKAITVGPALWYETVHMPSGRTKDVFRVDVYDL